MIKIISQDDFGPMVEKAGELHQLAADIAPRYAPMNEDWSDQEQEVARAVYALTFAIDALRAVSRLDETGIMVALGSVCGSTLAQSVSNRSALYGAFQKQFAASLSDVARQTEPQGRA